MANADWPVVFESHNEVEANLALGRLHDEGLRAVLIVSESVLYLSPVTSGRFKIKVPPKERDAAAALLKRIANEN